MRIVSLTACLCLMLASTQLAAGPKPKPLLKKALQARVEKAIDKGAAWLLTQQAEDGSFSPFQPKGGMGGPQITGLGGKSVGYTTLATLTLAHCGYGTDQPAMKRAVTYLREHYEDLLKSDNYLGGSTSYSLSIFVMILHQLHAIPPKEDGKASRYAAPKKNPCRYPDWARETMTEDRRLDPREVEPQGAVQLPPRRLHGWHAWRAAWTPASERRCYPHGVQHQGRHVEYAVCAAGDLGRHTLRLRAGDEDSSAHRRRAARRTAEDRPRDAPQSGSKA
ncbi:MAG: hypothetical protein GY946_22130 [bacterium]|nr:hypothetical protein [bacterium]